MSEKYKTHFGNTYFMTLTIAGWIDLFARKEYAEFIEDNLNYCIENKGLEVFNYCIMPNPLAHPSLSVPFYFLNFPLAHSMTKSIGSVLNVLYNIII
jgi:hypothetical protein